jgi:hypothetical protein
LAKQLILAIALAFALPAIAKQAGHHSGSVSGAPATTVARKGGSGQQGHGSAHGRELRKAPELDPVRKINAQDCTKPLDLEAGNLKCK